MSLAPLRDERAERAAENWRKVRARLRLWFWLAMLPGLALLWAAGYAQGLISAAPVRPECKELNR